MGTTSYIYDSINRLATETNPDGKTTAYTYDGSGNRFTETTTVGTDVTVISYTYDTSNKLTQTETKVNADTTQITSYTYDDNGNMLEKRLTPFVDSTAQTQIVKLTNVYDRFNQLTMSITDDGKTVCNTYNGEGLRIRKDVNGVATNYLYEGMKVVAEYDGDYNLGAQNVQGLNLLMRVEQNATYYYMYNGHADVTALLNAQTGGIDATYYYDAFGTVLSQTGNVSNSYLYAGYQYDEETGLYYLNARMYDSATARFIQEDTYRGNPNDPLSLNLYTYCANNPLVYHDPTGHFAEKLKKTVVKAWNWFTNKPGNPVPDVEDTGSSKNKTNKKPKKGNEKKGSKKSGKKDESKKSDKGNKSLGDSSVNVGWGKPKKQSATYRILQKVGFLDNAGVQAATGAADAVNESYFSALTNLYSGANFIEKAIIRRTDLQEDKLTHLENVMYIYNTDTKDIDYDKIKGFNNQALISTLFPDKRAYFEYCSKIDVGNMGEASPEITRNILHDKFYPSEKKRFTYDQLTQKQREGIVSINTMEGWDSTMLNKFNMHYFADLTESSVGIITMPIG